MRRAALSTLLLLFVSNVAFGGLVTKVGDLTIARNGATMTLLPDGRVLVAGGHSSDAHLEIFDPQTGRSPNVNVGGFHLYRDVTDSAEIFDPLANAFRLIAPMHEKRSNHTATLLRDGRVVMAGDTTIEIFDPQTETFIPATILLIPRSGHSATLLADGRVLIVGGIEGFDQTAEIYDPATNKSEPAGDIGFRKEHTATLLPNGHVLIAGGAENAIVFDPYAFQIVESFAFDVARHSTLRLADGSVLLAGSGKDFLYRTDVLRYRPTRLKPRRRTVRTAVAHGATAATIIRVGSLPASRQNPTATALPDGRVLFAGGSLVERRLELFDPRTGSSTMLETVTASPLYRHAATRLIDGSVLLTGGGYTPSGPSSVGNNYGSSDSVTFEIAACSLTAAGTLHLARMSHTATRLADGRVLIAGGENVNTGNGSSYYWRQVFEAAEIYDPATRTFRRVQSMHERRAGHSATLLQDGRVLIAGGNAGDAYSGIRTLTSLEIFDPKTETFTSAGSMHSARTSHDATLLHDGRVLITGGSSQPDAIPEVFDPATNEVQLFHSIGPRDRPVAVLRDGRVLVVGGDRSLVIFDSAMKEIVETVAREKQFDRGVLMDDGSVLLMADDGMYRFRAEPSKPRRRAVR